MKTMSAFYKLALVLCELDPEDENNYSEEVAESLDVELQERYCVDFSGFENLAHALAGYADAGTIRTTGESYQGFTRDGVWLYQREQ